MPGETPPRPCVTTWYLSAICAHQARTRGYTRLGWCRDVTRVHRILKKEEVILPTEMSPRPCTNIMEPTSLIGPAMQPRRLSCRHTLLWSRWCSVQRDPGAGPRPGHQNTKDGTLHRSQLPPQLLTRQALSTQSPTQTSPFQSTKNVYTRTMSRKRLSEATVCIMGSFLPPCVSSQ